MRAGGDSGGIVKKFSKKYSEYWDLFESGLRNYCNGLNYEPPILAESMRYSLLSGGKRMRPVLFFAALDCLGGTPKEEMRFAVALEMIHTYSLIHDDLPSMDNDDFRRGKPSNHKVFGEANAVLAGDALLSAAFDILLSESGRGKKYLRAAQILSECAGPKGMIAGQSADILYSGINAGQEELRFIYEHKTGKLFVAPFLMASTIMGKYTAEFTEYAKNLGILFQLTDDMLDEKEESETLGKTAGKDREEGKLTCVKVFGMERSEELADEFAEKCVSALSNIENNDFLIKTVRVIRERNH